MMRVKSVKRIHLKEPISVYDAINVPRTHNFIICGENGENPTLPMVSSNCALDEMSFGSNDNADYKQQKMMQIYNQLYLRISSRFSRNGKILGRMYLISSAKSTNAVLESFIRDNEGQPGMHVSRYKQWEVLPANRFSGKWFKLAVGNEMLESRILGVLGKDVTQEQIDEFEKQGYEVIDVPMEMMHRFEMDMNRTLIDTCGISLQSSYKYIPYRVVEPCIGEDKNPFISEIIKTGLKDDRQIKDYFLPEVVPEELYSRKIYIHCDLSKSGDRTGISAVAVLGYKNQERYTDTGDTSTLREMVFKHVFSVALQCPANDELSMIKVKDFLHYLKYDLGWNIVGVSCDGYQSLMLLQSLKLDGFNTAEVSMDIVKKNEDVGYTTFRNVLVEQRIKLLNLKELLHEITSLEKNETTGKVDHPRQCLVGSTRIKSFGLNGTDKTILELLEDSKKGISNYVYTINEKEHLIQIEKIKKVWKTGERDDLYEITIDDDNKVICTGNHPFMLQDFIYKEAKDLTLDDKLASLYPSNSKITEIKKLDDKLPVYDLEIENNHNFALNNGVFVHNSVKIVNGETIKSVGKDEADSLGGAIYNATLSVDINDLDFIDGVTITDSDMTLNQGINSADQYFGYRTNADGTVNMITNDYDKSNNVNEVVKEIQENNPDTKLTKEQIKDMYNELNNDDMFIF